MSSGTERPRELSHRDRLNVALNSLVANGAEEYFLDYVAVSSKQPASAPKPAPGARGPSDEEDEIAADVRLHDIAHEAVVKACGYFRRLDVPFTPPANFAAEMYRDPRVMRRLEQYRRARQERLREKSQARALRLMRRDTKTLRKDKLLRRAGSKKQEREIIRRWKDERVALKKKGVEEDKLPSLEAVEARYRKAQQHKRKTKDAKYSGRRTPGLPYRVAKRNSGASHADDRYVHRQFERR